MTDLASLSSLDDPVRRRLYEVVCERAEPVGRDEASVAAGVGRALAVYHLDKLVEAGLLTASYQRPPGRNGPGAGRPAKLYTRSDREFAVTVPPREYELAARLLVQAVESDPSGNCRAALLEAARRLGAELGGRFRPGVADGAGVADRAGVADPAGVADLDGVEDPAGVADVDGVEDPAGVADLDGVEDPAGVADLDGVEDLDGALAGHGYEPRRGEDGVIRLRNCPFHQLAEHHRDVVCGMNLGLIEGILTGLGADGLRAVLDPRPGHCCVAIGADQS